MAIIVYSAGFRSRWNPALLEARYVIPVGGMILGNCLRANIIGIRDFHGDVYHGADGHLPDAEALFQCVRALARGGIPVMARTDVTFR